MSLYTNNILVALGSNTPFQGVNGPALFTQALAAMQALHLHPTNVSSVWTSPAWPDPKKRPFTNAIVRLSAKTPVAQAENGANRLLRHLQDIESRFGRPFPRTGLDRSLDLDLVDFRGQIVQPKQGGDLVLPHPGAHERSFVLAPLNEVAPDWQHPLYGLTASALHRKALKRWPCHIGEPIRWPDTERQGFAVFPA